MADDPIEQQVADVLDELGEAYDRTHPSGLDFYLAFHDLFIECKRFATPRIADQLARVDGRDVVVIMGAGALAKLRALLGPEDAAAAPYDLHDTRQRLAIALLIGAVRLPAPAAQTTRLWLEAAKIMPGLSTVDARLGDRNSALRAARDLIEELIAGPESEASVG